MLHKVDTDWDGSVLDAADPEDLLELPFIPVVDTARWHEHFAASLGMSHYGEQSLGQLDGLARQLVGIRQRAVPDLVKPQVVVFAADHGVAVEGLTSRSAGTTRARVRELLFGQAPVNCWAALHGFKLTVVDAGVAEDLLEPGDPPPVVPLLNHKVGYGTRNLRMRSAMTLVQARQAIRAGMRIVQGLPGTVLALGDLGLANTACASMLLSRMCQIPVADACGGLEATESRHWRRKVKVLREAGQRFPQPLGPVETLSVFGGFEIAMLVGAMLQAASEQRVILVDGIVGGAAALVARALNPAVTGYLVFSHRSASAGHRLLLIHLHARPLLDLELRVGQGAGALMAWPLVQAAQAWVRSRVPVAQGGLRAA